jgi:hypothetical protein
VAGHLPGDGAIGDLPVVRANLGEVGDGGVYRGWGRRRFSGEAARTFPWSMARRSQGRRRGARPGRRRGVVGALRGALRETSRQRCIGRLLGGIAGAPGVGAGALQVAAWGNPGGGAAALQAAARAGPGGNVGLASGSGWWR